MSLSHHMNTNPRGNQRHFSASRHRSKSIFRILRQRSQSTSKFCVQAFVRPLGWPSSQPCLQMTPAYRSLLTPDPPHRNPLKASHLSILPHLTSKRYLNSFIFTKCLYIFAKHTETIDFDLKMLHI